MPKIRFPKRSRKRDMRAVNVTVTPSHLGGFLSLGAGLVPPTFVPFMRASRRFKWGSNK